MVFFNFLIIIISCKFRGKVSNKAMNERAENQQTYNCILSCYCGIPGLSDLTVDHSLQQAVN